MHKGIRVYSVKLYSITHLFHSIALSFGKHGGGESRDVQGLDYAGDQVASDVGDTINSSMDNLDAQNEVNCNQKTPYRKFLH